MNALDLVHRQHHGAARAAEDQHARGAGALARFGTRRLQPEQPRQLTGRLSACRAHWSRPAPPGRAGAAAAGQDARRPPRPARVGKPSHSRCRRNTSNEARRNAGSPAVAAASPAASAPPARPAAAGGREAPGGAGHRAIAAVHVLGQFWTALVAADADAVPAVVHVRQRGMQFSHVEPPGARAPAACARSRGRLPRRPARPDAAGLRDDWAAGTGPCGKRPAPGGHRPPHPCNRPCR